MEYSLIPNEVVNNLLFGAGPKGAPCNPIDLTWPFFFSNVCSFPCIRRSVAGTDPCIHLCNMGSLYILLQGRVHVFPTSCLLL
jgi:hypothetical protein